MTDTIDTQTVAMYKGQSYCGWLYDSPVLDGLFEMHLVPHDETHPIIVVAYASEDICERLCSIVDDLAVSREDVMTRQYTTPQRILFASDNQPKAWLLNLAPIATEIHQAMYPGRQVLRLVWSDEQTQSFPWDDEWPYSGLIQPLLLDPSVSDTLH